MTPEQEAQLLSQAHMMRSLRSSQAWGVFVQELKAVEAQLTEQLIQASHNDVTGESLRGEILGIRRVLNYPDQVIRTADQLLEVPSNSTQSPRKGNR